MNPILKRALHTFRRTSNISLSTSIRS